MIARNRILERLALDEAHRVERPAVAVLPQAVDGDDAGMFQAASDFRLAHEAAAAVRVVGVLVLNFLQRDLAVQLLIERDEDLADAAFAMWPQDVVAHARLAWLFRRGGGHATRSV